LEDKRRSVEEVKAKAVETARKLETEKAAAVKTLAKVPVSEGSRLVERDKHHDSDPTLDGDPAFYERLTAEKTDMKGIIR
jgi:hypothetical protein